MDNLNVVGWRAEWTGLNGKVASFLYDTKGEAKEAARWMAGTYEPLTPHAPAQAEIDRLREEVERLNACAQEEADTLSSRATDAEAIACSWKARALAAEAEVARLTASLAVWVPHAACPPPYLLDAPSRRLPMNNTAKLWAALCPLVLLGMIWGAALLFEVAPVAAWWVWPAFATLWIAGCVAIGVCMYRALTLWEDPLD